MTRLGRCTSAATATVTATASTTVTASAVGPTGGATPPPTSAATLTALAGIVTRGDEGAARRQRPASVSQRAARTQEDQQHANADHDADDDRACIHRRRVPARDRCKRSGGEPSITG